jgi:uncharacterized protein YndB with AHSA1/START domain
MTTAEKTSITVAATVNAPIEKVWNYWNEPRHIVKWAGASSDWHTSRAENDLRVGGKFLSRMEAWDGSAGFDFEGVYTEVKEHEKIAYEMADGRKVSITFQTDGEKTHIAETFDAEQTHSLEMQREGWQAILDNFKKHTEAPLVLRVLRFESIIDAPVEKVFRIMLDKKHYAEWTAEFNPTSGFEGSWEKGSKILFTGTDQDGKVGGMVSRIKENIPNKYLSIEHIGILNDGKEITSGSDVEQWAGSLENYTFTDKGGKTLLSVDMDSNEEFANYFTDTWPKALKKLKTLCEA